MRTQHEDYAAPAPMPTTRTTLAVWRCTECGVTCTGYIAAHDFKPRRCLGIPNGNATQGRICGGAMQEVYRGHA